MFDTLEEQIEKSEGTPLTTGARACRDIGVFLLSAIIFGALYAVIRLVE